MNKTIFPLIAALAVSASIGHAESLSDFRVQSDTATTTRVDKDNAFAANDEVYTSYERYIRSLLETGYPVPSVILHAASRGMTVSDIAYYIVLTRPELATEVYDALVALLPHMPSWVCSSDLSPAYADSYSPCAPPPMALETEALFDFDKSELRPEGQPMLDQLADALTRYPDSNILIVGHTDDYGSVPYNQALSERRARAIADYLRQKGVPAAEITAEGRGELEPRTSNSTPQGRQLNRRVEVFVDPAPGTSSCPGDDGPEPTIRSVAERYFATGEQLAYQRPGPRGWYYPDWTEGERHVWASVAELMELAKGSERDDRQEWWYQTQGSATPDPAKPVFVGIYKRDKEIVVNAPLAYFETLKAAGVQRVAVIFMYNTEEYLPTYLFESDDQGNGGNTQLTDAERGLTIEKVSSAFFGSGDRVSPTREWHELDFHLHARMDEVRNLFDIPRTEDLPPAVRDRWTRELSAGNFGRPVLITLYENGNTMWVDDPARVSVAASLGYTDIPVVFLYHGFGRFGCGLPGNCLPDFLKTEPVQADWTERFIEPIPASPE